MQDTINPDFPPSGPAKRRSRRFWQVAIGLAIVVVGALALLAWPHGGDGGGGGPLNAIAAAAEKTQQEPGGRALMHAIATVPGKSEPITMTGTMVYDADGRTQSVITVPHTVKGDSMTLESVSDGTTVYMHSDQFGSLPGGAKWMMLDFSFGDDVHSPVPANVDAKGELALLEAAGDDVRKLGKEDVRGVPTTHYSGTVSPADQTEQLHKEGADTVASIAEKDGSPLRVEAWIDAEGLVRRMRLVHEASGDGRGAIDMRMDFIDLGIEPEIEVPNSSEVFDATEMAQEKLGLSDDG